jgi:16S rRNA G966 N2-methylase RsmD
MADQALSAQSRRMCADCRCGYRDKLLTWIPRIAHWTLTTLSYDELSNIKATYFVDPPYNNAAGKKYATSDINYSHLADWCRLRQGQTIVCENAGAEWLPFNTLTAQRRGIHYGTVDERKAGEVVWVQETEPIGLWAIREPEPEAA